MEGNNHTKRTTSRILKGSATVLMGATVLIGCSAILAVSLGTAALAGNGAILKTVVASIHTIGLGAKIFNGLDTKNSPDLSKTTPSKKHNTSREKPDISKSAKTKNKTNIKSGFPDDVNTQPVKHSISVKNELFHKIKKNPWKTLGTVLLATMFPTGTIIAGTIAAGVVAKSGYDAYVNRRNVQDNTPSTSKPKTLKRTYSPKISPPSTPTLNRTQKRTHSHTR